MEYSTYLNGLSTLFTADGFKVLPDSPQTQGQGINLFAALPKYPRQVHRGNDTTVFVGVKYLDGPDAEGFGKFVKTFHESSGSSLGSYLGLLTPYSNVNWKANIPVMVSRVSEPSAADFSRNFKPDMSSRFHFVLDHPVLVNIDTGEVFHRETPAGRFGWGAWAEFFNELVSKYLIPK
jgi:hypothetical protein